MRLESIEEEELSCRLHLLESDIRSYPKDPRIHAERCLLLSQAGHHHGANRAFRLGARLCPDSSMIFLVGAAIALESDQCDRARERIDKALELDPTDPSAWRLLSAILVRKGAHDESKQARRRAINLSRLQFAHGTDVKDLLWSQHPILRKFLAASAWMDKRDALSKIAIKAICLLPVVGLLTVLEVTVANFPLPEAFVLALLPALFFGEISIRIGDAMLLGVPRLRAQMSRWRLAAGMWTLTLMIVFLSLVVVEARGHGGGPLLWVPFFAICTFGVFRKLNRNPNPGLIHSFGAMSALFALYGAIITPN